MSNSITLPAAPRILITRLSAIGDCIHSTPIVGSLRRRFPDAHIAWITQAGPASLLRNYPGLDEVLVVDRKSLTSVRELRRLRTRLRRMQFDATIDPQSLTKSSLLAWFTGARHRIGFAPPQGRELSRVLNNRLVTPTSEHVVNRYLQLIEPLCGNQHDGLTQPRFELFVPASDKVQEFLVKSALVAPFVVINAGAGWDTKVWPAERFGQLAEYLGQRYQLASVAVWAGDAERNWAVQIAAQSGGHCMLAPSTDLPDLADLLRRSQLCIAADTGPLHLAAALGKRCIGLYGPTNPNRCGPYGSGHVIVEPDGLDRSVLADTKFKRTSGPHIDLMRNITLSQVKQACDRMILQCGRAAA